MKDNFILTVKQQLNQTEWDYKKKEIIEEAVKELRADSYSDSDIKNLFKVQALKEQDNSEMINNNTRYLELLNDILNS